MQNSLSSSSSGKIKVLHLSTGHLGGAGLAARRLNANLNAADIDSLFLTIAKQEYIPSKNEISLTRTRWNVYLSGAYILLSRLSSRRILFSRFSTSLITHLQKQDEFLDTSRIIHIHNWHNLIKFSDIRKLILSGRMVVLTLHDQRNFTSGCHYAMNCRKFESNCFPCPNINPVMKYLPAWGFLINRNFFRKSWQNLIVIAPSKWLMKEVKSSYLFKLQNVVFAPNVNQLLNLTDALTPRARTRQNQLRVGVASMDPNAYLKFGEIIAELMSSEEILKAGVEIVTRNSFPQNDLGHLEFWSSIDCLLAISRADNSPNVIHEAKIAGIPVVTTNVGGIPELLTDNFDICLEPSLVSTKNIIACLIHFRRSLQVVASLQSRSARNYEEYSNVGLQAHIDIYKLLISRQK